MPDGWEAARGLNPGLDDAAVDADGDGVPNRQEYLRGTDPGDALSKNRIVYADADAGSAGCDGYFQTVLPGGGGPKATVQQAVDVAVSGDTLEVRGEAAFADAVVAPGGKKLVLRPVGHVRF